MRTIHKYELELCDVQFVEMPKGAKVLCVQMQRGAVCIWAHVEAAEELELRAFYIYGTGGCCECSEGYIGTVQDSNGFVWHVFEGAVT